MFNFLDCKLNPQVTSSCPATDGYEASNLITNDFQLKSKGFLAYTAIKPPVHIDFKLICPINIHYIKIWPSVGSQKSSAFEILVKNSAEDFNVVSKVYNKNSGVIIYNRKFYSEKSQCDNYTVHFFKSSEFRKFTCAEHLRLRILQTASSVPCIGNIEIWGNVSRICSKVTIDTINYLMNGKRKQCAALESNPSSSTVARNQHEFKLQIPEEFIDPISCEMMSLPMTLPSGKTIDQSTLEKCQESESKWGRCPSDPFTGQLFTSLRKPVLNTSLKSRIDEFLLKHADAKETQQIQRTVGRKPQAIKRTLEYPTESDNKKRITLEEPTNNQLSSSSNSLDDIIQNAIQRYNIVRYSTGDLRTSETNKIICVTCEIENNLYILLCAHYVCRPCLLKNIASEFHCKKCNKVSKKSDIKKYHNG